jgi:hypothetical protein
MLFVFGGKFLVPVIALMMEAGSTFETSVNFYETTRRNVPEGCHLNLTSVSSWGAT